MIDID
jgi:hypothetical protein